VPFDQADQIVVYGVNHRDVRDDSKVLSAASCTTHCIAPLLSRLDQAYGIRQVLMKEIHSYTSDQTLLDHVHRDPRRGRAGAQNIVPTTSSAIGAVQQVLPALAGKISGHSIRVPTLNVAMVELTLLLERTPDRDSLNQWLQQQSKEASALIGYNDAPLVSVDFNHRPESAIVDATQTRVQGEMGQAMVQIVAWYDNEWGYANRLLDWVAALAESHQA